MPDPTILAAAALVGAIYFFVLVPAVHGVKLVAHKVTHAIHHVLHPRDDDSAPDPVDP